MHRILIFCFFLSFSVSVMAEVPRPINFPSEKRLGQYQSETTTTLNGATTKTSRILCIQDKDILEKQKALVMGLDCKTILLKDTKTEAVYDFSCPGFHALTILRKLSESEFSLTLKADHIEETITTTYIGPNCKAIPVSASQISHEQLHRIQ